MNNLALHWKIILGMILGIIYGLIANSKEGVDKVVELLKMEFFNSMKLAGTQNFNDIKKLKKIIRF